METFYDMPVIVSKAVPPDKVMLLALDESDPDPTYHVVVASPKGTRKADVKQSELRAWLKRYL